jgi:hypothetical protein
LARKHDIPIAKEKLPGQTCIIAKSGSLRIARSGNRNSLLT